MKEQVFTDDQVKSLNEYQAAGIMHPFTCGNGCRNSVLQATNEGWICPGGCGYTQDWAHGFMANWEWKRAAEREAEFNPIRKLQLERLNKTNIP